MKETITSGKKNDPREAEKKGRRRSDYRGNRGRRWAGEGKKGQREKGKFTPRGKCPNRSTALLCRLRRRHRRPFKSFFLFGSVSARISESADLPCRLRVSVRRGCLIFIEDLSFPLRCAGRITISHKIVGMLCFNCCFRHEYDAASTAAASVRYRRVVGNEEEKIRRVKTRNKGRAMRRSDKGAVDHSDRF